MEHKPFNKQPIPAAAGIGLRYKHYKQVVEDLPDIPWFEVHSENFFSEGGITKRILDKVRDNYPLSIHGVGLSLGTTDALDKKHLQKLKQLVDEYNPGLVSEHVSWSAVDGVFMNDLLPLPYTEESLQNLVNHIEEVQEYIGRQILIENPSTYLEFSGNEMTEYEFMREAANRSGCGILLDINNIYVVAENHDMDIKAYFDAIPKDKVKEMHLAGHSVNDIDGEILLIDNHGSRVIDPVWDMYKEAIRRFGPVPTLIEWDTDIPEFSVLEDERNKAQSILDEVGE